MRALLLIFLSLLTVTVTNCQRVEVPKTLLTFLGTLEAYKDKQNDIVFLLDDSGSIRFDRFHEVKNFSKIILQHLSVSSSFSRIAILTFSTGTRSHVDYIQNPGGNACTLGKKIDNIDYSAGGTETSKAMEAAEKILARGTSKNKIVVLLTDGQSNSGYSPVSVARSMRSKGIIIFAIGVADVNKQEIDEVASSQNHIYILDKFEYIKKVNEHLVGDIKDDNPDRVDPSLCDFKCDDNANCYCGTSTGNYGCICNMGYFGVDGKKGQCHRCPKGTYKEKYINSNCTACPTHSTTENEGSTQSSDCRCDLGYDKIGDICSPVTCANLAAPKGGFLVPKHCPNSYGSKCSFHCHEGYCPFSCTSHDVVHSNKNHSLLPHRTCLETREWSNDEFICEKKTCIALISPLNGYYKCSENDFSHKTTCKFTCNKGYELVGSQYRTCEFGSWTGQDAMCKIKTCDQLKVNSILRLRPHTCSKEPKPFGSICTYFCTNGYDLVLKGKEENITNGVLTCGADGKWSMEPSQYICKDVQPPKITCPPSKKVNTDPNKGYASNVTWMEPIATDNVGVASVTLIEPKGFSKYFVFPINKTKVVYEATDLNKLKYTCSFVVEVIDNEPPQVISCPSDIEVYSDSNKPIPVTWNGPKFKDNSGRVSYTSNRTSEDMFAWGPPSVVNFIASDPHNNTASCTFTITVKPYECPYYKPPANGLLTCDNWNHGKMCSIFCHDGFQFARGQDLTGPYVCSNTGRGKQWKPFRPMKNFKMPWPDCARKQAPTSVKVSTGISYSVDSCSDQVLQQMKERFFNIAKTLPSVLCPKVKNGCSPENVRVTCNPIESKRRKRSTHSQADRRLPLDYSSNMNRAVREATKQKLTISYDIRLLPEVANKNFGAKQTSELKSDKTDSTDAILKTFEDKISLQVKDMYHLTSVPNPIVNHDVTIICSVGQIELNNSCMSCPPGTYKDDISGTCIDCPRASYQDEEGKLSCKKCPVGYTTYEVKSKSRSDCKGPCQPGTHSRTTFEPCFTCPLDTYQDRSNRKFCLRCPPGLYTWRVGANSSSDCVAPCKPGTFSDTGFEPCSLCDAGSYQYRKGKKNCTICPYGTSTSRKGADNVEECKEIDICRDLQPCHPESVCIPQDKDYECVCPEGPSGKNCEVDFDDCAHDPCFNNGSCVDLIGNFSCLCPGGWTGYQCETDIDDCASSPCLNSGTCVDKLGAYECHCIAGFSGERCEQNIYECESNPCLNNGTCFDMINGYRCCCAKGFSGENCEIKSDIDPCDTVTCKNGGVCSSNEDTFTCNCLPGYEGDYCEFNIDDCEDLYCDNGGYCVDGINNATCMCPTKFTGFNCERTFSPEFLLSFPTPATTSNYASIENKYRLPAITVAFYMRTSNKDPSSRATPISYSYKYQNEVVDNALTFLDTNKFVLYIHGHAMHTEYSANKDAYWHHYAVTWEKLHGNWTFYVDGNIIDSGNVGEGKYMHPGIFVLGQEQDDIGGQFSTLEAFTGDITEFNVWDYALTEKEIKRISSFCGYTGNVIPWYKVSESVYGNVVVSEDVDKCKMIGSCPENSCDCFYANKTEEYSCKYDLEECIDEKTCSNGQYCASNNLYYFCNCSEGFEGRYCEYDVDECINENGNCSHVCVNDIGAYHCECPDDMLLSEDEKTCKDTSYCLTDDAIYMDGETWMDSCQNCTCIQGIIKYEEILCDETVCNEEETKIITPGECCPKCVVWSYCSISSNKSMMSFDMTKYDMDGKHAYTALEDCIAGAFQVQIEFSRDSTNKMNLILMQDCSKILTISYNGSLLVDDDIVEIPYVADGFIIEHVFSTIIVKTKYDLIIRWDFVNEAVIGVPISKADRMCGLCSKIEEYYVY